MLSRRHRVALVDATARTVGVTDAGALPAVADTWPNPTDLARAVGLPAVDELCPPWRDDDGWVTHVVQKAADAASAASTVTAVDLDDAAGIVPSVRQRIAAAIASWTSGSIEADWPQWYGSSWRADVDAWVDECLGRVGDTRVGAVSAEKVWSLSAVLRYRVANTSGHRRDVWFKATYGGFRTEPAITAEIAAESPALVPTVIATDLERAWMLLEDIPGAGAPAAVPVLLAAAAALAESQLRSLSFVDRLIAAGAPVRDTAQLLGMLRQVVDDGIERGLRTAAVDAAARAALPAWERAVRTLGSSGVPLTLVHGDLHAENIAGSAAHPIVFDWTDACISHPYLDARQLAESVAQQVRTADADAIRDAVWRAFAAPWRAAYPDADHDGAWTATAVARRVFTLGTYEQIYRSQPVVSRWELGGISADHLVALLGPDGDGAGAS